MGELVELYMILHHDEDSKTAAIDDDGVIRSYSSAQIRPFPEQPSAVKDVIVDREIKNWHKEIAKDGNALTKDEEPL